MAALDQVLTVVEAVVLVVFKLTSQASFQDQLSPGQPGGAMALPATTYHPGSLVVPATIPSIQYFFRLAVGRGGEAVVLFRFHPATTYPLVEMQILPILQETVKIQYLIV